MPQPLFRGGRLEAGAAWSLFRGDEGEARDLAAVDLDGFGEHLLWADPPAEVAVEQLIDDEDFLGLGVAGEAEDAIFLALVVAVAAGAGFGGKRRERSGGHRER